LSCFTCSFQSTTEAIVLILQTGLLLQYVMGFNFSVAVWVGYIALFGIAVETGVVMVIYLHEALNRQIAAGEVTHEGVEAAASGVQCSGFDRS
jgi:copper/silver efflux system protein